MHDMLYIILNKGVFMSLFTASFFTFLFTSFFYLIMGFIYIEKGRKILVSLEEKYHRLLNIIAEWQKKV